MNKSYLRWRIASVPIAVFAAVTIFLLGIVIRSDASVNVNQVFINGASNPPCVADIRDLPIFEIRARMERGESFRGSTFLIDHNHWATAAHVVDGDIRSLSIYTPDGVIQGKLVYYDEVADVAVIKTPEIVNYDPIVVKMKESNYLDSVWNVGYPGWANDRQVVSSGKVIGYSEGMIYTNAMVMTGMSGGPTLSCDGDNLEATGVISMFSQELLSVREIENGDDAITEIEKTYINSGESFSAILHNVDYSSWVNYRNIEPVTK